jgi:TRAP-type C4-dicarboxylate transport system permease large subunit
MNVLILTGAAVISLSMGATGLPLGLGDLIAGWGLSRLVLLMVLFVFYVVRVCFMDGIS